MQFNAGQRQEYFDAFLNTSATKPETSLTGLQWTCHSTRKDSLSNNNLSIDLFSFYEGHFMDQIFASTNAANDYRLVSRKPAARAASCSDRRTSN